MNKLLSFVRLDFLTVKPFLSAKYMTIYVLMVFIMSMMFDGVASGASLGIMLSTLMINYPFAIGEKSNMDGLYIALSINKRTVVLGRYLYVLVFNICAITLSFVIGAIAQLISQLTGFGNASGDFSASGGFSWLLLLLASAFLFVQAFQLPIYFKLGYSKARLLSIVPLAVFIAAFLAFSAFGGADTGFALPLTDPLFTAGMYMLVVLVLAAVVFASYRLSVLFYRGREF